MTTRLALPLLLVLSTPAVIVQQTASLAGVVVDDAGRTVRLAVVTVGGPGLPQELSTVTDDAGAFLLRDLPAGRFTLSTTKRGYVPNAYGARRPGRRGTAIQLAAGQTIDRLRLTLPRGAVITGVIRDRGGDPVPGAEVSALRPEAVNLTSNFTLSSRESAYTDDRGVYRLFGLAPGDYIVTASMQMFGVVELGTWSASDLDGALAQLSARSGGGRGSGRAGRARTGATSEASAASPRGSPVGFAPTYYPGTASIDAASRITVAPGDERANVDFALSLVPMGRIEGIVVGPDGSPQPSARVTIAVDGPRVGGSLGSLPSASRLDASGRFEIRAVPPGTHTLQASVTAGRGRGGTPPPATGFARASVTINGDEVTGLVLRLQPGLTVSGRIAFDATTLTPPAELTRLRVTLMENAFRSAMAAAPGGLGLVGPAGLQSAVPAADRTFAVRDLAPGSYTISAALTGAAGWWLRSAMSGGFDLLDVDLVLERDVNDVVLTFTDRQNELTGRLETGAGQPAPDYFIVVFPADRSIWKPGARRVQTTRPDTAGVYTLRNLPAGDYLLAALTDVEADDLGRTAFLEALVAQAVPVVVRDGQKTEQGLRIAGGPNLISSGRSDPLGGPLFGSSARQPARSAKFR